MIRRTFLKSLFGTAVALPAAGGVASHVAARDPVVLQRSPVAGFQFHESESVWSRLGTGDALDLVREPDNPHDKRAVAVRRRGCKLGYIPGKDNCTAAQLLDHGQPVSARITALQMSDNPWERIQTEIVL